MHFAFDLKFKHWSADGHSSMTLEAPLDHIKNSLSDCHLEGLIVSSALSLKYMHSVNPSSPGKVNSLPTILNAVISLYLETKFAMLANYLVTTVA